MMHRPLDSQLQAPAIQPGPGGAPLVRLSGVAKDYGRFRAVYPLDLTINTGDFVSILGPSGCGKTTLLRILGGFIEASAGRIEIDGVDVTGLPPEKRPTNMVFQSYGLFPHMSVRQNIGYGLRLARVTPDRIVERVEEMIALVQLGELADHAPAELSGGQQQRVALARALIMRPKVLLLDEPFAALDLKLRKIMQQEMRRLHEALGGTFVFVTHDQGEAMALANRIAVMQSGHLRQFGSAEEIYLRPVDHFVSTFVGEANFLPGTRKDGHVTIPSSGATFASLGPDGTVEVGLRPERVRLGESALGADMTLSGTVRERIFLGAHIHYVVDAECGQTIIANVDHGHHGIGETVSLGWMTADQWVVAS